MISAFALSALGAALPVLWAWRLRRQRARYYTKVWVRLLEVGDYSAARSIYQRAESEGFDLIEEAIRG